MTRSVEARKHSYRQQSNGKIMITFELHPHDDLRDLSDPPPGTVYELYYGEADPNDNAFVKEEDRIRPKEEPTDGERLRTRAVLLCKDPQFQVWVTSGNGVHFLEPTEENAAVMLREICGIDSRSELALSIPAQEKFKYMEQKYREETGQMAERRSP